MRVIARVDSVRADRTSYKQYSPDLSFQDVYVEFEIPDEEVKEEKPNPDFDAVNKILTIKGFTLLLDAVATSADEADKLYKQRLTKGGF